MSFFQRKMSFEFQLKNSNFTQVSRKQKRPKIKANLMYIDKFQIGGTFYFLCLRKSSF